MFDRRAIPIVLGLVLLSLAWISTEVTVPNERSRIYLAVSLIDHQSVSIDEAIERFGSVPDRAGRDGHSYTDKAPGSSVVAAVVYGLSRLVTESEDWTIEALLLLMRFALMIPLTVVGFFILRHLLRQLECDEAVVDLASFGWLVASPVLHYGQAFYGHQIVAVCLLGAVACLLHPDRRRWHLAAAGACAGVAGLTEYQAAIPCVLLALWVLTGPSRKRPLDLAVFFGAAAPFAIALFAYHTVAFGGPLELSYHHLANPAYDELHSQGIGGVLWPTREAVWGGFFSLHRGLFTAAPIFAFALIGFGPMARQTGRRPALFIGLIVVFFAFFIASSNNWEAGWSYGPRLLVSVLAVAAIPMAFGLQRVRHYASLSALALAAFAIGVISNVAMKASFFEVPTSSTNPLMDVALPMIAERLSSSSWLTLAGFSPAVTIAVFAVFAALLMSIVMWRYVADQLPVALAASLVITALFFTFVYLVGPSWNDAQVGRFDAFLEKNVGNF